MTDAFQSALGRIRYQSDLVAALQRIALGASSPQLCIGGPRGCGQGLAAAALGAWKDGPVVRVLPAEVSVSEPGEAVDRLRRRLSAARGGVAHLVELEALLADSNGLVLLAALREHVAVEPTQAVVISGDREAVAQMHALSPDLYTRFTHATVRPFTSQQLTDLLVRSIARRGLDCSSGFAAAVLPSLNRVRPVGDLSNGRITSALARTAAASALSSGRSTVVPEDVDVRMLRTVDSEPGAGFADLDRLIGLTEVKSTVRQWVANYDVLLRREQLGLNAAGMGQHMVFKGPAGTAKTTVARIMGRVLAEVGVLNSGHLVEVQRADLIGEGGDQVARRVVEVVKRSLGGVLFVDEAYSLMDRDGGGAGREAIDTLLKLMEDYRDEFVVVVAGYPVEMEQFLNANPGLRSRFVRVLEFPAYEVAELLDILSYLASERGYRMGSDIAAELEPTLRLALHYPGFGNGRHMRNLLESAIVRQAMRLSADSSDDDLRTLVAEDFREDEQLAVSSLSL